MIQKKKVATAHGRFQIFHNDHLDYILSALRNCEHLIIGITSYDIRKLVSSDKAPHRGLIVNNPLTYEERTNLISNVLLDSGIDKSLYSFSPFPIDLPELLPNFIPTSIPCFTTLREKWNISKVEILKSVGYEVIILKEDYNKIIEASKIRKMMMEGDSLWQSLVPRKTVEFVFQNKLIERLKRLNTES